MRKIYLLVQNDVRTGPFTLEELLQQSLQSESLIWVIGESEDWLSPLEVPSLQMALTKNDKGEIVVKEEFQNKIGLDNPSKMNTISSGGNKRTDFLDTTQLEEFNNPAEHIPTTKENISLTAPQRVLANYHTTSTKRLDQERNISSFKSEMAESEGLGKNKWPLLATMGLLVLLIIWSVLSNDNSYPKKSLVYSGVSSSIEATPVTQAAHAEVVPKSDQNDLPMVVPPTAVESEAVASLSTASFLDSVERVLDAQDQLMDAVNVVYRKSFFYPKHYLPVKNKKQSTKAAKLPIVASKIPLEQQVDLQSRDIKNSKQQLSSVEVLLRNNSKELLQAVSVDVFLYKKGEQLLTKETVYFSNVYPRQSVTMSIPGNHRAISSRMKLGTITSSNRR